MNQPKNRISQDDREKTTLQKECERHGVPFHDFLPLIEKKRKLVAKLLGDESAKGSIPADMQLNNLATAPEAWLDEYLFLHRTKELPLNAHTKSRDRSPESQVRRFARIWEETAKGLTIRAAAKVVGEKYDDNYSSPKNRGNIIYQEQRELAALEFERNQIHSRRRRIEELKVKYRNNFAALAVIHSSVFYGTRYIEAHEAQDDRLIDLYDDCLTSVFDHPVGQEIAQIFAPMQSWYIAANRFFEKIKNDRERKTLFDFLSLTEQSQQKLNADLLIKFVLDMMRGNGLLKPTLLKSRRR